MAILQQILGAIQRRDSSLSLPIANSATSASRFREFGFALRGALAKPQGNVFFSPVGISLCLSMLIPAARGRTRDELRIVLGVSTADWDALGGQLAELAKDGVLALTNGLFAQSGTSFLPDFEAGLGRSLGASPQVLDFHEQPQESTQQLNHWCASETGGLIEQITERECLLNARLVLANATCFHGDWDRPFRKRSTRWETFRGSKKSKVQMMRQTLTARYAKNADFAAVDLPYYSGHRMLIVLPEPDKTEEVFAAFDAKAFDAVFGTFSNRLVDLTLPRFTMDEETADLAQALVKLGIREAFAESADLSGGTTGTLVSHVLHRSHLHVTEQGTEEAAVAATVRRKANPRGRDLNPIDFRVGHPFLFVVCAPRTRTPVFIGQVRNLPSGY